MTRVGMSSHQDVAYCIHTLLTYLENNTNMQSAAVNDYYHYE